MNFYNGGEVQYMANGGDPEDIQDYSDAQISESLFGDYTTAANDYGLDSDLAGQAKTSMGQSEHVKGLKDMQGSFTYAPVEKISYDILGLRDKMNQHARNSLSRGVSPSFSRDAKGNITSVTGPGGPSSGMPGIGTLLSMIGTNMGVTSTTGYNQDKSKDSGNDEGDFYNPLIRIANQDVQQAPMRTAASVYNANPNQYTLNVSGINSLRNK